MPFGESTWRSKAPPKLIYADTCGLLRAPTFTKKRILSTLVDDSRMIWVYFLEAKLDALSIVMQIKDFVKNQRGHRLKALRTDHGGEFI